MKRVPFIVVLEFEDKLPEALMDQWVAGVMKRATAVQDGVSVSPRLISTGRATAIGHVVKGGPGGKVPGTEVPLRGRDDAQAPSHKEL